MSELSDRQKLFAAEYPKDLNATQAALRAGYSERSARQSGMMLTRNPLVQGAIAAEMHKSLARAETETEYVLRTLREIVERCMQKVPVLDNDGEETGEWKFDPARAIKALELLGRRNPELWARVAPNVQINLPVYQDNRVLSLFESKEALLEAVMALPEDED